MFQTGPLYLANLEATEDIIVNQGGTASGKTYAIMQVLSSLAISNNNLVITATAESVPHIERGLLRDLQTIIANSPELQCKVISYNATKRTYTFDTGSIIEMPVFPDVMSAHGPKRDILFINEAPSFSYNTFEQLMDRTRIRTYIDYNPSIPFWVHERLLPTRIVGNKKVKLIISDHRHNPFLTEQQHDHIEKKAEQDPEWGRVYARGLTGKIEGLIFRNWHTCEELPKDAKLVAYGLDFGFTNDPSALIEVRKQDGELWVDLLVYETGLTNPDIYNKVKDKVQRLEIVADSAEPKSIQELNNLGLNVYPAQKGKDSIMNSIDILKRYKINITSRSLPLIKELNAYKYKVDKVTGNAINEPVDFMNHAIDALRYVALNKLSEDNSGHYNISFV